MTVHIPPDRALHNQEAVDLVIALQRCLANYHASPEEPAILPTLDEERLAQLVRYMEARRLRHAIVGQGLFSDPAWDLMLILFRAELEDRAVSLDAVSEATRISMAVVLRHIGVMERRGLLVSPAGAAGGRRRIRLSPLAMDAMISWLSLAFGDGDPGDAGIL